MTLKRIDPTTSHTGDGWNAQKNGRTVCLTLNNANSPVELPEVLRPGSHGRMVVVDSNGATARAILNYTTNTIYWDNLTSVYGTITYFT